MPKSSVLLVGERREMAPMVQAINDQFPEALCQVVSRSADPGLVVREYPAELLIFHWHSPTNPPCFDAWAQAQQSQSPTSSILVVMDTPCTDVASHVLQHGAAECLHPPICVTQLVLLVSQLTSAAYGGERSDASPGSRTTRRGITLPSQAMLSLMDSVRLAARTDATVLLLGESGTGKNYLAWQLHQLSTRRHEPLVTVDCGASSPTLIESDLFGHVRGAFTGADREHTGKLERAGRGALMLDEIDSLPLSCQSRLLRVLEERVFEKVGDQRTRKFEARVIALSNRPLEQQVLERKFRQDLFYRLNVIAVTVPALRERPEDVRPLAHSFAQRFSLQNGLSKRLSEQAIERLSEYCWPGNVRELRNVLERAVVLSVSDIIGPDNLDMPHALGCTGFAKDAPRSSALSTGRSRAERAELVRLLQANGNNRTRTAAHLGISRSALYKRLVKLDIKVSSTHRD